MKKIFERIKNRWQDRYQRHYKNKKLRSVIDLSLVILIFILALINFQLNQLEKKIRLTPENAMDLVKHQVQPRISADHQPLLELSIEAEKSLIKADEALPVVLKYKNKEDQPIDNMQFYLSSGNENFRLTKISSTDKVQAKVSKVGSIEIGQVAAGGEGEIPLVISFEQVRPETNQSVRLSVSSSYEIQGLALKKVFYSNQIKLLSNLIVSEAAYYFSPQGDQLGVGPLPPKVDFPTTFWLFLEVRNFGNDLKPLAVTGRLPSQVKLTGNKSLLAGELKYSDTNQIEWLVDQVEKSDGVYRAGFEVEIMPNFKQLGQNLDLMTDLKYATFDQFCQAPISGTLDNLSTRSILDRQGKSQGKVAK